MTRGYKVSSFDGRILDEAKLTETQEPGFAYNGSLLHIPLTCCSSGFL